MKKNKQNLEKKCLDIKWNFDDYRLIKKENDLTITFNFVLLKKT